jgi:CubicO group peptidase (beta-lactamase class C family)
MRRAWIPLLLLAALLVVGVVAVASDRGGRSRDPGDYVYVPPQPRNDGLDVAPATDMGIDTIRVGELVRPFFTDRFGEHTSLLVMKEGRLIVEEYFDRDGWRERRSVQSVSKSITSLLVGYGVAKGYIASIDDPIGKYLPRYRRLLTNGKDKITVRHLLTMTSGLEWNEHDPPYSDSNNLRLRERNSTDAVAFILDRPLVAQPGESRVYNGGGMTILGEILTASSGLSPDVLLERAFTGLLDRDEIRPTFQKDGRMNAAGGFHVTSRGMAKIGQMLLQNGRWNGDTVFSPDWIRQSTESVVGTRSRVGYGYLWWQHNVQIGDRAIDVVVADGLGGQYIAVIPELDLVIVLTASNYDKPIHVGRLIFHVVQTLGIPLAGPVARLSATDSASAYPPAGAAWTEIFSDPKAGNRGAGIRSAVDTRSARRLDDGSYLVWTQVIHESPAFDAGKPYNTQVSRFILRCETPTDGRFKRVSSIGFLNDGPPVFLDVAGLAAARAQPWTPAWGAGSLDLTLFQRTCSQVKR